MLDFALECEQRNTANHHSGSNNAMNSWEIAAIVFACAVAGALVGMLLRSRLPEHHLVKDSQDVIRLTAGLIGSMAALVLGLLVAAATSSFNNQQSGFQQLAANIVLLDRALAHYGPAAKPARDALRSSTQLLINRLWPADGQPAAKLDAAELTAVGDTTHAAIRNLTPTNDQDRDTQSRAMGLAAEIAKIRWQLSESDDTSLPRPFFVVLTFWLTGLFLSFGLFAPRNITVLVALVIGAASVAGAVFLVVDLAQPYEGLIQISSAPLEHAFEQLGR